jgi:hypothetical protein
MLADKRMEALLQDEEALERLRKNYYHLWKPLTQAKEDPGLLEEWEHATRGSIG